MSDKVKTSKYIAYLLRHHPEAGGLTLDEYGYAETEKLIAAVSKKHPLNMDKLQEIVRTDEKQRYAFNEDKTKIRAVQGHSIAVNLNLQKKHPPEYLFHGTGEKYTASIEREGLIRKNRMYVHLSADPDTAYHVGIRHGRPVIYTVASGRMDRDGYDFYLSENNVWLCEHVPAAYLERTEA